MRTTYKSAAALLVVISGCNAATQDKDKDATPIAESGALNATAPAVSRMPAALIPEWDASRCNDDAPAPGSTQRHPRLMKRSPAELRAAFGSPSKTSEFRMGEVQGTFGSGLGSLLPGGEAANARRMAREETWTKSGCNLTVFFADFSGQWSAIDAFEWSVDADF